MGGGASMVGPGLTGAPIRGAPSPASPVSLSTTGPGGVSVFQGPDGPQLYADVGQPRASWGDLLTAVRAGDPGAKMRLAGRIGGTAAGIGSGLSAMSRAMGQGASPFSVASSALGSGYGTSRLASGALEMPGQMVAERAAQGQQEQEFQNWLAANPQFAHMTNDEQRQIYTGYQGAQQRDLRQLGADVASPPAPAPATTPPPTTPPPSAGTPAPAPTPAAPAGPPAVPPEGLPPGWTQEQWDYYGQQWLDQDPTRQERLYAQPVETPEEAAAGLWGNVDWKAEPMELAWRMLKHD